MGSRHKVTELHIDDAGFVRVPEARCYRALTDVVGWPTFWPGTVVHAEGDDRYAVRVGPPARRLHLELEAGSWRHDAGFTMQLTGDVQGRWEIWLEPLPGGTVVHHVVAAAARRPHRSRALRRWLRRGLWGLKDLLEEEARSAMLAAPPADRGGVRGSTGGRVP